MVRRRVASPRVEREPPASLPRRRSYSPYSEAPIDDLAYRASFIGPEALRAARLVERAEESRERS
jgi:hypothetical protein